MTPQQLAEIQARIPTDQYCLDCHECATRCSGAVRLCEWEWEAIAEYIDQHIPVPTMRRLLTESKWFEVANYVREEFCILYDMASRRCAVYPVRPLICRLFGHVVFMPCPHGKVPGFLSDGPEVMQRYAALELRTFAQWFAVAPSRVIGEALSR